MKGSCAIRLIKHSKHDYKIPKLKDVETKMTRKFTIGKGSSAHGSHMYKVFFSSQKLYELNKNVLFELVKESYEMASSGWDDLLKIEEATGKFKNKEFDIVGGGFSEPNDDRKKFEELALKYLDPGYEYDI